MPFLDFSDVADAGPAIFLHSSEVFQAVQVGRDVGSLLVSSLFADGVGLVDVVDASDFEVVGAVVSHVGGGNSEEG